VARHKVEISGVNTANIKVLTNEQMLDLFSKYKNGNKFAREDIINGNLKLVLSILKSFNKTEENKDDLFQVGCVGLLKAVDNFDPNYGVKFSTYCVPMIQGEIRRYIRDNNSIRVSRSLKDLAYKIMRLKEEEILSTGKEPTIKELAKKLEVSDIEIMEALESRKTPMSIFEPIYNDGGDTIYLYDQIEDTRNKTDIDIKMAVTNAINELNEREQYILDQRFIIGKTQTELASELGISQAQISRIEKKAIDELKKTLK
jgi:RNA polymerase sporulation-specific sigma factor